MEGENFVYFRPDLTEYITQEFVEKYNVQTEGRWIPSHGYYSEKEEVTDRVIGDGAYILVGHVDYNNAACYHKIGQFVGIKSTGINWVFSHPLDYYPNSKGLNLDPIFALIKVGAPQDFGKVGLAIDNLRKMGCTAKELERKILQLNPDTVESKIYRLRLALQRQLT